jgi:hypothetical protein
MPGVAPAWRVLTRSANEGSLSPRAAALVALAVAQRAGGDYARWALACAAAREGLGAEDIFLATAGTALDPREATVVKAAGTMASQACFADTAAFRDLAAMLGAESAAKMLAHVTLALLACDVLDSLAPERQPASPSRREA